MQMIFARGTKVRESNFSFILDYESDYSLDLIYFFPNIKTMYTIIFKVSSSIFFP